MPTAHASDTAPPSTAPLTLPILDLGEDYLLWFTSSNYHTDATQPVAPRP